MFVIIDSGMHSLIPLWLELLCQLIGTTSTLSVYLIIYDLYSKELKGHGQGHPLDFAANMKVLKNEDWHVGFV